MADQLPPDLTQLLASSSRADRRRAIEVIAGRRLGVAIFALEKIAATDRENDVRLLADRVARYLREEGIAPAPAPPAPPELEPALMALRAGTVEARHEAARKVLTERNPAAVPALIERAWGERDAAVKVMIARALAVCADLPQRGSAVGALEQAVLTDLDARVRRGALLALDLMESRESATKIIERCRDDDAQVAAAAAGILERWGLPVVLTAARSMLLCAAIGTREAAVRALSATSCPEAIPLLAWALTDPVPPVSDAAREGLTALAAAGLASAAAALSYAPPAAPRTHEIHDSAGLAAGSGAPKGVMNVTTPATAGGPPGIMNLTAPAGGDALDSAEPGRRLQEIREIVARGDVARAPALIGRLAREGDTFVQSALVNALGRLQAAGSLPSFLPLLASPDQRVRANAVEAIGWLGGEDEKRRLVPLLSDRNNRVRANAVVACHGIPGVDVSPVLREMLASPDTWTRKSAVYAIRTLADPELTRLLDGPQT